MISNTLAGATLYVLLYPGRHRYVPGVLAFVEQVKFYTYRENRGTNADKVCRTRRAGGHMCNETIQQMIWSILQMGLAPFGFENTKAAKVGYNGER